MFLFAGPNGSGKSTIVNEFIRKRICPSYYICPDNNIDKRYKDNKKAYIEAMQKAEAQRYNAVVEEKSFSFESVFSTTEKLEFIKYVKSQDYFITVVYVVTKDPQINIQRIHNRVLNGGHDVPKDKVISRYYKSMALMSQCLEIADDFFLFDNSTEKPILVMELTNKKININSDYNEFEWIKKYLEGIIK
jgi:predicted ABC-type ATPase